MSRPTPGEPRTRPERPRKRGSGTPTDEASRRTILRGGGAFVLSTWAPLRAIADEARPAPGKDVPAPNAFISIGRDHTVTVQIKHLEMGQGIATGLCTIVAEELGADWTQMRYAFAPANTKLYSNLFFGPMQGTGTSTSTSNSWMQLRRAAAAMREMMVAAAASRWAAPADEVEVADGMMVHRPSGRRLRFGDIADAASRQPVPADPRLKAQAAFGLIGRPLRRLDVPDKTTGDTLYTVDVRRPGQLYATILRPPRFGAKLAGYDATRAREIPGVVAVIEAPPGVAVIARDTWSAMQGKKALVARWDEAAAETRSTDEIMAHFKALAAGPGRPAVARGDMDAGFASAVRTLELEFEFPYLAHAPLEPLAAVIQRHADGRVDLWTASQSQTLDQAAVARILGIEADRVAIHTLQAGGSFGRRSDPRSDYVAEAAEVLKAFGGSRPIQVFRTREDDFQAGLFRPMAYHRARVGVTASGDIAAWDHVVVGKSITAGTVYEPHTIHDGVDVTTADGLTNHPYAAPNFRVKVVPSREGVSVTWWRAVSHTHTAHAVEVIVDALAELAGEDPVAYRMRLLAKDPRRVAALRLAADKAGWGARLAPGRGRGVAVHSSHGSSFAAVAEVSVTPGAIRVDRVVVAVDCGVAINPDNIRAQFEGGTGFMLSSILSNRITLTAGEVQERNFDSYQPTRLSEMPRVEVHIVPSTLSPGGVGEPAVICVGPAIVNAVHDATGEWRTSLPLQA
ncbi:MAG: xanthine dehydrogenase family protein molybdopterin-binding subunit [Phenylobacterium sp.]|uniref:xanthine dehydrogenase family protein molybdopterin-binding subunit n=1 Tax=Phenylobacterium sp. TaxID=1871053 RepID=UPI001A3B38E6|nr:molybdopterin cofactor-binding domain-containing protein [Phenylobacterium sp.]MBL8555377.1 xanthine dehydrogenase family protein molybdopterin-binding subunit [Phenylobacterium sp.]